MAITRSAIYISDTVYDNIVGLVTDTLDLLEPSDFENRREYLGRIVELNEMLDELQGRAS